MHCLTCQSTMDAGDLWCAHCGASAVGNSPNPEVEDPVSQRKFVTILRADVVHSTDLIAELEPEQALLRLEPALAAMRAAVRQFGGIVSKEMCDGLAAGFGASVVRVHYGPPRCRRTTRLGLPGV